MIVVIQRIHKAKLPSMKATTAVKANRAYAAKGVIIARKRAFEAMVPENIAVEDVGSACAPQRFGDAPVVVMVDQHESAELLVLR